MDRIRRASISVCSSGLSFSERQIALRQIVDELQELCDGAPDPRPILLRLLHTIRASMTSIAGADDDCWEDIIRELFQLRATMVRLRAEAVIICH
ncbi:hypothetical protein ATY75_01705 [Rhizobium sp. N122]|uniref:hypothetical protein n=1 Tax=Rhizobium sp. N122 TaxID=1764272 RepID=UPI000B5A8BED|nr:hypothetical protein [Rhizobium sp. N122]OWV91916.1 hypothetical protein ATY75_01705 [Rhizobium sp. N122]